MSFSGKRFRRVRTENVEELLKETHANENVVRILQQSSSVFSFTRVDEDTFNFTLASRDSTMNTTFKLGQEVEMQRRDGTKVKVTYTLDGENTLKQIIKVPEGGISYFKREFGDKETKMTITMDGTDIEARIYYELVE